MRISLSISVARVSSNLVSLTQRDESQRLEVQCRVLVHVVRLGAVLSILHVAVGPLKIMRVGAIVLFAKLGGATGPYLSLVHDMPLA